MILMLVYSMTEHQAADTSAAFCADLFQSIPAANEGHSGH